MAKRSVSVSGNAFKHSAFKPQHGTKVGYGVRLKKKCKNCLKQFVVKFKFREKLFCNNLCLRNFRLRQQKTYKCKGCSTEFKITPCDKRRKFCSYKCFKNFRRRNRSLSTISKICKFCKNEYQSYACQKKIFCSDRCFVLSQKKLKLKLCLSCEAKFDPWNAKQVFCSQKCSTAHRLRNGRKSDQVCDWCKGSFKRYPRKDRRPRGLFCSLRCYGDYQRDEYAKKNTLSCLNCKKDFVKPPNARSTKKAPRKFCSRPCMFQYMGKKSSGGSGLTAPERLVNLSIRTRTKSYKKQVNPLASFTTVDFFVPSKKLCIYVDGDYWHSMKGIPEKDLRQKKILEAAGFNVLRIPEKVIMKLPKKELVKFIFGG